MVWADRNGFAEFLNDVEWIIPARPQGASNMLTVIAGSMEDAITAREAWTFTRDLRSAGPDWMLVATDEN